MTGIGYKQQFALVKRSDVAEQLSMKTKLLLVTCLFLGIFFAGCHPAMTPPTVSLPPDHPFVMQDSVYPIVHSDPAANDATRVPSWKGSRSLSPDDVDWLPWVTGIGTAHRPYADGEEALFVSGTNKVGKIRITDGDFTFVDEIIVPGFEHENPTIEQTRKVVNDMLEAGSDEKAYLAPLSAFLRQEEQSIQTLVNGAYTVMDHEGSFYAGWGTTVHKISDQRKGAINSPIEIVKSFDLRSGLSPAEAKAINRLVAISMTYDGYLVVAMPGIIAVLDRNLEHMEYILLEGEAVDNGVSVDKNGGIYVVTSKYMRKLVWDGSKLSDQEVAGAWKTEYDVVSNPKALSRGAGNTPALLGHGPDDDRLVILADAGEHIKIAAFWRDEIPDDFKQKPGTKSRRVADQLELTISVPATIEWSPHVYGNGVMMMASAWPDPVLDKTGQLAIFESVMSAGVTRQPPVGVEKWSWDRESRRLISDWTILRGLQWGLHPVSASSNTVTLTILEEGLYSLLTVDWDTGEQLGETTLGKSPIFNTMGGVFIPIDEERTYITGIFGPVMIKNK